jgi:dimethylargininase
VRGREAGQELLEPPSRVLGRAAPSGFETRESRSSLHAVEVTPRTFGCQSMTGRLERVLVKRPAMGAWTAWRAYGWRAEPDPAELEAEHEAFRALLAEAGAEVVVGQTGGSSNPDAIYAYDPALVADSGAVLLMPGKEGRRREPEEMGVDFMEAGVPLAGQLRFPATVEGGDTVWLDESTLLVGRGYRTNDAGIQGLRELLPDVDVIGFDLPHHHGAGEVLHLMSFISPLDVDLAVVYLPLMPVRLCELLRQRGIELVEVPDEEFESMGPNALALAPRVALALEGNNETRRRLEAAGVEVRTYKGDEISRKGDGGPTCLTRPLLRS